MVKSLPANAGDTGTQVQSLSQENPLEDGMATHVSIPAWRIPCTEEPAGLQSVGLQSLTRRTNFFTFTLLTRTVWVAALRIPAL